MKTVEEWEKLLWTPGVDMGWPEKVAHRMIRDIQQEAAEEMRERCEALAPEKSNAQAWRVYKEDIRALPLPGDKP